MTHWVWLQLHGLEPLFVYVNCAYCSDPPPEPFNSWASAWKRSFQRGIHNRQSTEIRGSRKPLHRVRTYMVRPQGTANTSGTCKAAPTSRASQNHHRSFSCHRDLAAMISPIKHALVPQATLAFVISSKSVGTTMDARNVATMNEIGNGSLSSRLATDTCLACLIES